MASGRAFEHIDIEVQTRPEHVAVHRRNRAAHRSCCSAWRRHGTRSARRRRLALRQTGKGGDTWFWRLFGKGLVAAQVALSIFLVTAAAVFLSHLSRLRNFDLGFRSDHVLLVTLDPAHSGYKPRATGGAVPGVAGADAKTIPQVRSASISGCTPLQGCGSGGRYLIAEGHVERPEDRQRTVVTFVAPRYFETLGIPLIAGRDFTFRDAGRPRVAIVNQAMARRYFPGVNPIGKHVRMRSRAKMADGSATTSLTKSWAGGGRKGS